MQTENRTFDNKVITLLGEALSHPSFASISPEYEIKVCKWEHDASFAEVSIGTSNGLEVELAIFESEISTSEFTFGIYDRGQDYPIGSENISVKHLKTLLEIMLNVKS